MRSRIGDNAVKMVFLDRDGVINENRPDHVKSWDEFVFLPGALDALRRLREDRWRVCVITNQASVNRRIMTRATLDDLHDRMLRVVSQHGGHIDDVYYCPHRPEEACDCRKPRPGLLLQAAATHRIPLDQTYLIGDALTDIIAGRAVGATCFLVQTGRGTAQPPVEALTCGASAVLRDLRTAVQRLIHLERERLGQRPGEPVIAPHVLGTSRVA